MMLISGDVNGLYVYNSLFSGKNEGLSYTHYRAILGNGVVTNAEIRGNYFEQFAATSVYIDGIKLTKEQQDEIISRTFHNSI